MQYRVSWKDSYRYNRCRWEERRWHHRMEKEKDEEKEKGDEEDDEEDDEGLCLQPHRPLAMTEAAGPGGGVPRSREGAR